ncbi:putative Hexose transport-related protein [Pseudohyphozyma bogoriensis]|nr:putative Hexose transport-related protein [Pseudohyphozyma bogoriensis]
MDGYEDPVDIVQDVRTRLTRIEELLEVMAKSAASPGPSTNAQSPPSTLSPSSPPSSISTPSLKQVPIVHSPPPSTESTSWSPALRLLSDLLDEFPAKPVMDALVDFYFTSVKYPMDETVFRSTYDELWPAIVQRSMTPGLIDYLPLIFILLATATLTAPQELLSIDPAISCERSVRQGFASELYGASRRAFSLVETSSRNKDSRAAIMSQILAVDYLVAVGNVADAFAVLGGGIHAARLLQAGTAEKKEVRKSGVVSVSQTWSYIFHSDCYCSLLVSQPPTINLDDFDVPSPPLSDFVSSDPHEPTTKSFLAYRHTLAIIMGNISTGIFSNHEGGHSAGPALERRLQAWSSSLPSYFAILPYGASAPTSISHHPVVRSQRWALCTEYHLARMTLHRRSLNESPGSGKACLDGAVDFLWAYMMAEPSETAIVGTTCLDLSLSILRAGAVTAQSPDDADRIQKCLSAFINSNKRMDEPYSTKSLPWTSLDVIPTFPVMSEAPSETADTYELPVLTALGAAAPSLSLLPPYENGADLYSWFSPHSYDYSSSIMAGGSMGALLNKDALKSTPPQVLNFYLFFCSWIISTSGALHGYNSANISGILAMTDFKESFHLDGYSTDALANIKGWATSVIVLGGVVGALLSAPLNDRLGRRLTLFITGVIYLVGCVVQIATTSSINQVIVARAIEGFGAGLATVTGTMFVAEIAPKAVRGLLGAFFSANTMLGVALGYWGNYGSITNISEHSHWIWRVPLLIQMIPGIIIVAFTPFHSFVLHEFTDITAAIEADKDKSLSWIGLGRELLDDSTLMRRITYYQTNILASTGITGTETYLFSGVYGLMKMVAVFVYAFVCAERFGRRIMLLTGAGINILCVAYVALYLGALDGNKSAGWAAVAAICLFAIGYGIGFSPIAFGLTGELFPNHLRAKIMSICLTLQYLINFLLVRFFTNITLSIGSDGPFIIFAVVTFVLGVYLYFALPETKGHMTLLFADSWWLNGLRSRELSKEAEDLDQKAAETFEQEMNKITPAAAEHLERSGSEEFDRRALD